MVEMHFWLENKKSFTGVLQLQYYNSLLMSSGKYKKFWFPDTFKNDCFTKVLEGINYFLKTFRDGVYQTTGTFVGYIAQNPKFLS